MKRPAISALQRIFLTCIYYGSKDVSLVQTSYTFRTCPSAVCDGIQGLLIHRRTLNNYGKRCLVALKWWESGTSSFAAYPRGTIIPTRIFNGFWSTNFYPGPLKFQWLHLSLFPDTHLSVKSESHFCFLICLLLVYSQNRHYFH